MQSSAFAEPIRINVKPSGKVKGFIYLGHSGAMLACWCSDIPFFISSLAVLLSLLFYLKYSVAFREKYPFELLLNNKDEWLLIDNQGAVLYLTLLPEALVHPRIIILRFRYESGYRAIILTPDVVPRQMFRRLAVRLRFPLIKVE